MHRFFVPPGSLSPGSGVTLDDYAHQLHTVLRLQPGATVMLLDGSGMEYPALLTRLDARHAQAAVEPGRVCASEPKLSLTLYQCSLKGEKFEWVLQKGVELGVRRFVPVVSKRSIVRPVATLAGKAERWRAVIREAAEQSCRAILPELAPPVGFETAIVSAQGQRLLPWEESGVGAPLKLDVHTPVSLLVGPEGGFETSEVEAARAAGWQVITLGPRILRAETAAIASVAALMALAGQLGRLAP
jgi:16S rRNA (uracil1498-N3)-methyltransferase